MLKPLLLSLLQNDYDSDGGGVMAALFGGVLTIFWIIVAVIVIAGMWKVFVKAGKPGWAAIIPIYNVIVLLEIVGRPLWWVILFLIPCVNIIASIIINIDLAKSFGKDVAYGIGLALLGFIFYPMLGFGTATYVGPSAATANNN